MDKEYNHDKCSEKCKQDNGIGYVSGGMGRGCYFR